MLTVNLMVFSCTLKSFSLLSTRENSHRENIQPDTREKVTTMDDKSLFKRNQDYAKETLGIREWLYYRSGADNEQTLKENEKALERIVFVPSVLSQGDKKINLKTKLLGKEVDFPIGISPTAYHEVLHPDGELATAKAASKMNLCYQQSFHSNKSIEEISTALPNVQRWLNIRNVKEREYLIDLIRRGEKYGYGAFVITVDSAKIGNKLSDKRTPFKLPPHIKPGNLPLSTPGAKEDEMKIHFACITWDDIKWIKSFTKVPIVLKGILTAEDAKLAVDHGVAAIQVSNHGGRQLDCSPASIEALAEISQAVGGKIDLFLDGGIRCGADVLKALALGAKAVFLGRPVLFGLHYNGAEGVKKVLQTMRDQLTMAMVHTGCTDVNRVPRNIVRSRFYSKI